MNNNSDIPGSSNASSSNTNGSCEIDETSQGTSDRPQVEMKSISIEEYRKILNATVELYKANETIRKLEFLNEQKDLKIEELQEQLEAARTTKTQNFSLVSLSNMEMPHMGNWSNVVYVLFYRNKMKY